MSTLHDRRTSISLASLWLLAQLVLAWHMPSHLQDDHQHSALASFTGEHSDSNTGLQDNDPCALGINGHGVAAASAPYSATAHNTPQPTPACAEADYRSLALSSYQARGPPLHS